MACSKRSHASVRALVPWILACMLGAAGCGDDEDSRRPDGSADAGDDPDSGGFPTDGGDAGDDPDSGGFPTDGGDGDAGETCSLPTGGLYATFSVVGEVFRAHLTSDTAIADAIDLWQGNSNANIPNGTLVCEPAPFNCGYSWHLEPGTIDFAELTIEVCDGTPSYIEDNCDDFVDNYCPWSAELIDLRDCRTDPTCPQVPREAADFSRKL